MVLTHEGLWVVRSNEECFWAVFFLDKHEAVLWLYLDVVIYRNNNLIASA